MPSEACVEELETLSAIFLNEITINATPDGTSLVSMILYPATADDEESRYVTLTLDLSLNKEYPKVPPKIVFRNPRGLNDVMIDELMMKMNEHCQERLESQMIYELIDMCKEFLTRNNRPASECPICLLSFTEFDVFFRTRCFHHFHSYCLGKYLQNLASPPTDSDNNLHPEKQLELTCPVCRELMEEVDIEKLLFSPPPSEELEAAIGECNSVLQEWENQKEKMQKLFEKQKSQGGIIDLTESKKLLVISNNREGDAQTSAGDTAPAAPTGANTTTTATAAQRQILGDSAGQAGRPRNNHQQQRFQIINHNHSSRQRTQPQPSQTERNAATATSANAASKPKVDQKESATTEPKNNSKYEDVKADQPNGHYRRYKGNGNHSRRRNNK